MNATNADDLLNFDFEFKTFLGLRSSTSSGSHTQPRAGLFAYSAAKRAFIAHWNCKKDVVELSSTNVLSPRNAKCPNGCNYIIRFQKPGMVYNELTLTKLSDGDKQLIHKYCLLLAKKEKLLNNPAPGGNQTPIESHFPGFNTSIQTNGYMPSKPDRTAVYAPKKMQISERKRESQPEPSLFSPIPPNKPRPEFLSPPPGSSMSRDDFGSTDNEMVPETPPPSSISERKLQTPPSSSINNEQKPLNNTFWTDFRAAGVKEKSRSAILYDEAFVTKRPRREQSPRQQSPRPGTSKSPDELVNNKENEQRPFVLCMPPDEDELPEKYTTRDFWRGLKMDEKIRSGMSGEWIKGQDEHLTVEGLLCLRDGEWLNADMIDAYLSHTAKRPDIERVRYIPTYALLSYERKRKIPTEWYWKLKDADLVLAPAHLNNNHWAMAEVHIPQRTIWLKDSMNNGFTGDAKRQFMQLVLNILLDVSVQQGLPEYMGAREDWTCEENLDVPQQGNGTDCGIFALLFARFAAQRKEPLMFNQQHIPYYRRRMCFDIVARIH